jgi:hypothetical protein
VRDIEHWKGEGFAFEKRFPGEYDLWVNRETMQRLRRYVDGREWLSDLKTGEYALVQDTPNAHALAEERSDDSQQRVVGGKVDR